jgi:3-deoxy-7-phosphoheptulonate synthase
MIIVMRRGSTSPEVDSIVERLTGLGYSIHKSVGVERTIIGAVGSPDLDKSEAAEQLRAYDAVEDVIFVSRPYKFVAKEYKAERTVIDVRGVKIGGPQVVVMAGPCTIESEEQLDAAAEAVAKAGATVLRGGAYKPSTSPYSYHGMGEPGLDLLHDAGKRFNLRVITEVMDVRKVELVAAKADILQIGTRNMQNYDLLREVGQAGIPVMLKRGMSAKYEEWLLAAEYIAAHGNDRIILCERGIRTFETHTRNTLDLSAVPVLHSLSHLPVVVDPSHGTGRRELVAPMCKGAVACGADGLMVEVHPNPDHAVKDGPQSVTLEQFQAFMPEVAKVAEAVGRSLASPPNG